MATAKENFYKQMALDGDDPIVRTGVGINYQVWEKYKEKLDWMEGFSKYVGVGISRSPGTKPGTEVTNMWGERWIYPLDSLDGICIEHPILSLDAIKTYTPPDPDKFTDWNKTKENFQKNNELGNVNHGGTDHGFIFLRSTYLRGYNNFMIDIADDRPEIFDLIKIIENYWFEVIRRYVECGVNAMGFGDDMGMQTSLPISLEDWRKYIKPSYKRIFSYCRAHGVHVSLHSDGYINDIIPDLIECGVSNINPQDLVNGLDNIKRLAWRKVFIHLDIDRQNITVRGTPEQIDAHIFNCIKTLGSPKGGLDMGWGVYPGTPIESIEAGVRAMDKYATYWVGRKE